MHFICLLWPHGQAPTVKASTSRAKKRAFTVAVYSKDYYIFQELLELAQRKFQRQVATIADRMELSVNYPRLFVLDFITQDEKRKIARKRDELEEQKVNIPYSFV